jgi:hypothetical protein
LDNYKLSISVDTMVWKRPALPDRCWLAGKDWLCLDTKRHEASGVISLAAAPLTRSAARAEGAKPEQIQEAFRAPPWRAFGGGELYQTVGDFAADRGDDKSPFSPK